MELPKTLNQQENADGISEELEYQLLNERAIYDANDTTEMSPKDAYDESDDVIDRSKGTNY